MSKNKTSITKATTTKKTSIKKPAAKKSTKQTAKIINNAQNKQKEAICKTSCYFGKSLQLVGLILIIVAVNFVSNQYLFQNISNQDKNIANWIANNPEKILESVINMQKKEAQNQQQNAQDNIKARLDDLYNRKDSPIKDGNNSDVTIIEFFDYNCGYCKKALNSIEKIIQNDKKVKVIFKELPILGKSSEDLAKVALAFNIIAPSKYFDFHSALMKSKARTSAEAIKIAETKGVTKAKINKILKKFKAKINEEISLNRELSATIGIRGTPAFLIGDQLFPGAVGYDALSKAIEQQRSN